ncbi:MAG TPA: hypothetical protein VHP38_04730 [Ruminiclostridium sp.]|nr:hypothetical protein [Ruminiclostridium sp.]
MVKERKLILISVLISIIFLSFTGCVSGGLPKNISENDIYPKGAVIKAKTFDTSGNEKVISLSKKEAEYIVHTLKASGKEVKSEYESDLTELNITFTDSVIQLIRRDADTIYYVFHNSKINGICYRVQSKDLSLFISSKVGS